MPIDCCRYRGRVLVDHGTVIANRIHRPYPKQACVDAFDAATRKLRAQLPFPVQHCARFVRIRDTSVEREPRG